MNASLQATPLEISEPPLRCLFVSRDIPFPLDAGDRIYSAHLARALADTDVEVRYVGYAPSDATSLPSNWSVHWLPVKGRKRSAALSLLSSQPRIAAMHATAEFRSVLQHQLQESWDAIILDGYASGWALDMCLATRQQRKPPVLVYVSHNHEASLWRAMQQATARWSLKRLLVWQNTLKVDALERRLLQHVDLVTTITENDALTYAADGVQRSSELHRLVLTPGYAGQVKPTRRITHDTPRHVVMLGSFRWLIKQENLRQLIAVADPVFAAHNIVLDIIGDVPDELRKELSASTRATRFHGFVEHPGEYLDRARIALVPEVVGGGFKLKFLDYVFARLPVFTLEAALSGVPSALSHCMVCRTGLPELIEAVMEQIDATDTLDSLQSRAWHSAAALFRWQDRGMALANSIRLLRDRS